MDFIEYFRCFYGEYGHYPIPNLSNVDIIKGVAARGKEFEADSIDRETIRDMILYQDFKRSWNPMG